MTALAQSNPKYSLRVWQKRGTSLSNDMYLASDIYDDDAKYEKYIRSKGEHSQHNTLGTMGWSRLNNRTLAVKKNQAKISFFRKKIKIT